MMVYRPPILPNSEWNMPMAELSDAQRTFLDARHYAVVGTLNADNSIQQTVVWYLLDGDVVWLSIGANSVKANNLRRSGAMTLTIEDGARYLTLTGTASLEPSNPALRRRLAERYIAPERIDEWLARRPDAPRAIVRMTLVRVYGQGI